MTAAVITVIVAIVSGLAGTMLRISFDRGAEIRTRMLNAADEFSIATITALQEFRGEPPDATKVNHAVNATFEKLARVHLLFGDLTRTGLAATATADDLRAMERKLGEGPDSIEAAGRQLIVNHGLFNREARKTLHDTAPRRFVRWLRDGHPRLFGWLPDPAAK
jgi:hypothetical protein